MSGCSSCSIRKKGWIRGSSGGKQCPFGLPIPLACKHAGGSTAHMCPIEAVPEEKRKRTALANKRVYIHYKDGQRCMYARDVIESKEVVNCDFGDVGQGMGVPAFEGSPLYAQTFSGVGLDGLYAFPLGFYADNNESRNLFQGLFSLLGSDAPEILKNAVSKRDEQLWKKIEMNEGLSAEEKDRLEAILARCRAEFEEYRSDPAKVEELARKYAPSRGR